MSPACNACGAHDMLGRVHMCGSHWRGTVDPVADFRSAEEYVRNLERNGSGAEIRAIGNDHPAMVALLTAYAKVPDVLFRARSLAPALDAHLLKVYPALHSCQACGRHPQTHVATGDECCPMCGLGDER